MSVEVMLAAAGVIITTIGLLPGFLKWRKNRLLPRVTIHLGLSFDEMVALDPFSPWSGNKTKRYAVAVVENRRGGSIPLSARFGSRVLTYPTLIPERILEAERKTYYAFEMEEVGDPTKATFTLMSHGWKKTYRFGG